jgi:hypothetical protein
LWLWLCGLGHSGFCLLDTCQCFTVLAESALFLTQSSGKIIIIVLLPAQTLLITEVVVLEVLDAAGPLSLQILEIHEQG